MANKCLRCGRLYDSKSIRVLLGCECGSKLFLLVKNRRIENKGEKNKEEQTEIVKAPCKGKTVFLDFETINITPQGYEIDLQKLMNNESIVVKLNHGNYYIDLVSCFGNKVGDNELKI